MATLSRRGFIVRHGCKLAGMIFQIRRHEDDENCAHPVEAEALRAFVADDVRNARRHAGGFGGRCPVGHAR